MVGTPIADRGRRGDRGADRLLRQHAGAAPATCPARRRWRSCWRRVQERALGAQHHQDIPFEQVVELVQPARSLAHAPLFQVMFALAERARAAHARAARRWSRRCGRGGRERARRSSTCRSSLRRAERRGSRGRSSTPRRSSSAATVERYVGYLRRVLEAMVADAQQAVDALPLLPEAERRQVLEEWNRDGGDVSARGVRPRAVRGAGARARRTRWRWSSGRRS